MEALKVTNSIKYSGCDNETIGLIRTPVTKSPENDYQRKWEYFQKFLSENGIPFENITVEVLLRFLTFLFYTKGMKPSSVSHYRSALE